ncbi:hypothetical protein [Acidithiobacillus caldus]|uniref:hypothetical protein n=1 Tax=Acidithiobacillus caldus TaxID=33059 RepID=UPI0007D9BCBA|nr:hypothetical protein [Acidithiobacillus caldus]QER43216.1 hypothetical protein F0726_00124 [Acidithiobacillus caldus]
MKSERVVCDNPGAWPQTQILPLNAGFDEAMLRLPRYNREIVFGEEIPERSLRIAVRVLLSSYEHLRFMGLADPDIRVRGPGIEDDFADDDEVLPPCVTGDQHICIAGFVEIWTILCRLSDDSTSAHRRYKDQFPGELVHFRFDGWTNNVRCHMSGALRDALNDSYLCWVQGA